MDKAMTVAEAADRVRVTPTTVRAWIKAGFLEPVKQSPTMLDADQVNRVARERIGRKGPGRPTIGESQRRSDDLETAVDELNAAISQVRVAAKRLERVARKNRGIAGAKRALLAEVERMLEGKQ